MSGRELVVLGTASQAPTRDRNHNGYLLRWDGFGVLFDPGEGTQRQMVRAGVASSAVDVVCVTHLHGDHCLGLPGVLARMTLDGRAGPVEILFPEPSELEMAILLHTVVGRRTVEPVAVPARDGVVRRGPPLSISARWLDHTMPALGWRLEEPPGRAMDRDALERAGITGPAVGALIERGSLRTPRGTVRLEDVSLPRPGRSFAFIMDTRPCPGAVELARGADLVVCESTFLSSEADLAHRYGHMTAAQAATLAAEAGARRLVLTHFSQRHPDEQAFAREAATIFPDVVAARDLDVVAFPGGQGQPAGALRPGPDAAGRRAPGRP
ncbi:MAG TPA: MBL fold metallo-hydrolase [Acidimicrobiales bacterium]|nr:MBL fold metallo-hydrolase [Acidimicrobiales bacterium]